MRRLSRATALGFLLACSSVAAAASSTPDSVVRNFLRALFTSDAAALRTTTLPGTDIDALLGAPALSAEERAQLDADLGTLEPRWTGPFLVRGEPVEAANALVGARATFSTGVRGLWLGAPVVRTDAGWRVDADFFIEGRKSAQAPPERDDPRVVARAFLGMTLANELDQLDEVSARHVEPAEVGSPNGLPGGDLDQIISLAMEMPVVPARAGTAYKLPSGELVAAGSDPKRVLYVGLMGPVEVPFVLVQVGGAWKVEPQNYFAWMRARGAI
jgi:hypothetical protein